MRANIFERLSKNIQSLLTQINLVESANIALEKSFLTHRDFALSASAFYANLMVIFVDVRELRLRKQTSAPYEYLLFYVNVWENSPVKFGNSKQTLVTHDETPPPLMCHQKINIFVVNII